MSITRPRMPFERDFVQIPNAWMRDKRLSRRARGLLAELMTHEAGWKTSVEQLVANGPEGRDAVRAAVKELESLGYLRRERARSGGRYDGYDYMLCDPFAPAPENPSTGNPTDKAPKQPIASGPPAPEKPSDGKPASGNPPLRTLRKEHKEEPTVPQEQIFVSDAASGTDADKPDPVILALCNDLADRIKANGSKRPTVSKAWLTECDRLVRLDGKTVIQVRAAIEWCQNDPFWKGNILSMPKLREKYDQMRLQAQRERDTRPKSTTSQRLDTGRAMVEELEKLEAELLRGQTPALESRRETA